MAELLIVVVVVVVLLGYAADRARKLRVRARQLASMNDRLDAAVAKVDEEQHRHRARARASAELTSVLPAIKRPPLTIPGMAGHGGAPDPDEDAVPDGEAAPETAGSAEVSPPAGESPSAEPEAGPSAEDGPAAEAVASPAAGPAAEAAPEAGPSAEDGPAAEAAPDASEAERGPDPAEGDAAAPAPASRLAQDTLSMPAGITANDIPVPKLKVTSDGTLIMRPIPDQGPAPAGEALPAPDEMRNGMRDQPATSQERTHRRR